jgi:hypothetical protein
MPLPRIQSAQGWSGVERRNAFRRGVGREGLTAHPTGARLVWVEGQERPSSWCRARKPDRVSNRRTVGEGRRNRAGFLVVGARGRESPLLGRGAAGGRSASPAKRVVYAQHTACPISASSAICNRRRGRCHKLPDSGNARQPNHVTIRYWPSATNGARNTGGAVTVSPIAATVIRAATARTDL